MASPTTPGPADADQADTPASTWRLNSGGLFMRAGDDEAGKLAKLADVRDWLMQRHQWPMERAAGAILDKLHQAHAAGLELFIASGKAYARPLRPDDHMLTREALRKAGGLFHLDDRLLGFQGVCNAIANGWLGEWKGYGGPAGRVEALCVRVADAAQLWGWGTATAASVQAPAPSLPVADWPALVTYRKAHRLSPWTLDQRTVAKARFDQHAKAGTKVATLQDMARELGICRQALDKALHAERKRPEAPAPAPAATVVRDGRKVA